MRTEAEVAAMQCPVCRVPLAMSDRQGIEIDYCPQEASAGARQPAAPLHQSGGQSPWAADGYTHGGYGHGGHAGHGQGGKHHKRRKSWLDEIFD